MINRVIYIISNAGRITVLFLTRAKKNISGTSTDKKTDGAQLTIRAQGMQLVL